MEKVVVKFKKLDENATIPSYAHEGDIGMDIKAIGIEWDEEKDTYIYHTGLAVETEEDVGMWLLPRSSNTKKECYLPNSIGLIDTFIYRGELQFRWKLRTSLNVMQETAGLHAFMMALKNGSEMNVAVKEYDKAKEYVLENARKFVYAPYGSGDKIGQMVMFKRYLTECIEVDKLSETVRGTGGFGSTGK